MFLQNLTITKKLLVAFAFLIAISVIADSLVFAELRAIQTATRENDVTYDLSMDVQTVFRGMVEQQNAVRGFVGGGDTSLLKTDKENADAVDAALDDIAAKTANADEKQEAIKLKQTIAEWRAEHGDKPIEQAANPATHGDAVAAASKRTLTELRAE